MRVMMVAGVDESIRSAWKEWNVWSDGCATQCVSLKTVVGSKIGNCETLSTKLVLTSRTKILRQDMSKKLWGECVRQDLYSLKIGA